MVNPKNINVYYKYNMPKKILMNFNSNVQASVRNLYTASSLGVPKAPSALNSSIIARIHNVRPGCGSCGR
jgi:hypothetical protein